MVLISLILLINVVFLITVVKRTYMTPRAPTNPQPSGTEKSLQTSTDPLTEASNIISAAKHAPTAAALANLIRALYLDQSTFTFNLLEPLDPDSRRLAAQLVTAHLTNRYRADEWEQAYEGVKAHTSRTSKPSAVPI